MKRNAIVFSLLLAGHIATGAQNLFQDDDFFVPAQYKAPWLGDWGASVSPAGLYERQGASDSAIVGLSGNLWLRLSLPGQWLFYARIRDNALVTLLPVAASGMEFTNIWEVNASYLQLVVPEVGFTLSVGRKPFLLGSGLALSGNGDGLEFQLANPWFTVKAFGFYTGLLAPGFSTYSMDSWDDENGARRYVGGYQAGVSVFGHELSVLGLYQGDFGLSPAQQYSSWYAGLQARGMAPGGDYLVEWFLEDGYSPLGASRAAIDAFGGTCRYQIAWQVPASPAITVQYSLASGDPDRTSSQGSEGNSSGQDGAFQAFGQLGTGSVFRPHFSNVHIVQLGFNLNPFEAASSRLRNSVIGLRYFYYAKYDKAGVVDSGDAALPSFDLGHGIDLVLRWLPWNDLSTFINAGLFLPGAAFPSDDAVRFTVSGGMSLSF